MGNKQDTYVYDSEVGLTLYQRLKDESYNTAFYPPDVVYNVHTLRHFLEQIPESPTKRKILNHTPMSCNYKITFLPFCCCQRGVKKVLLQHINTSYTLEQHFNLLGLQKTCEIGIRQDVQNKLQLLLLHERKNPHSPLSHQHSPFYENQQTGYVHYRPPEPSHFVL